MSAKLVIYLGAAIAVIILLPALVAGGSLTFAFALPVLLLLLAILVIGKVFWDWKLTRDFGRNSGMNPRDLVDPGVEQDQNSTTSQQNQRRAK